MFSRFHSRFWLPPRSHSEVIEDRTVSFLELFYDLVYVVVIARAAHALSGHVSWRGVGEFAVVFGLIWIGWLKATLYYDRHGREDGLVLSGNVLRFKAGGSELAKTSHEMDLEFADASTGERLYRLHIEGGGGGVVRNLISGLAGIGAAGAAGSAVATIQVQIASDIRDMEDDVARDIAYALVQSLPSAYTPPADLEVRFGETPYPPL